MPKYNVKIIQKRIGYVEIKADSKQEAIEQAEKEYILDGNKLPEMDDCEGLEFSAHVKKCKYFSGFDGCACNNDPDDLGDCIYENGIEPPYAQIICNYYSEV